MSSKIYKKDKEVLPMEMNRLYREGEVPEVLKGRGIWKQYGSERLFCPFGGSFYEDPNEYNWKCDNCGHISFWSWIRDNDYRCLGCNERVHKWRNGK